MYDDFLKILEGIAVDRIVWTADLSYWIAGRQQDGTASSAWDTEKGYLELHAELGVMPYYYYDKFWTAEPIYENSVSVNTQEFDNTNERVIQTPVGSLNETSAFMPESCCEGITRHMVNKPEDMDVLLYLLEHRKLTPANLDDYQERSQLWQTYDGLPCLGLPRSPLSALCYEWTGVQNLAYLLMDCPEKVETALALLEEEEKPILDAVCLLAPPLVHFPDNLSSDNLTGYYDAYMRDGHRRRIGQLHAAGVKCAVHLDGTVKGLLPKLAESGFDAIEALTPKPAGDAAVEEMRDLAGNSGVILWGGVPGIMFSPPYEWSDMEKHMEHVLESWSGQPYVLGVADQVPPDGDIELVKNISKMIRST
jgi:hypothetical protein